MPEFVLDHGTAESSKTFKSLDSFTQGYIEAIFWTSASSADDGDLEDATFAELAPDSLVEIIETCREFQESFADDLAEACDNGRINGYDEHRAGVDFWLTRNRHGAGFWDRGLGDVGKTLTDMAHPYGESYIYRGDDGLVHIG